MRLENVRNYIMVGKPVSVNWQVLLIGTWTLTNVVLGQFQHMMQMQYLNTQRTPTLGTMRLRGPVQLSSHPRWGAASNQIPIIQRPYKHPYAFVKPSPYLYRTPKPIGKYPMYSNFWKSPVGFRPMPMKDAFRSPPVLPMHQLAASMHQFAPGPASAQKLYATSPVKNMFVSAAPTKNIYTAAISNNPITPAPINYIKPQIAQQTTQTLVGPVTPVPVVQSAHAMPAISYPIRVEGDGGPIHTIPAPNLSGSHKPIVVPDYAAYLEAHAHKIKSGHRYEVTEDTNEKQYPDQSPKQTSIKFSPPANYFSSIGSHNFLPQPSPLQQVQPAPPSLTSQELYNLLSDVTPQQQLADTYPIPLLHQPQLQQHFSQQIKFDSQKPLQSFSGAVRPSFIRGFDNNQENVLFRPVEKPQEYFISPSTFRPTYHPYHKKKPIYPHFLSVADTDRLKNDIHNALENDLDLNTVHYNIVRNTEESYPQSNRIEIDYKNHSQAQDSAVSSTFNVENEVNFKPINVLPTDFNASAIAAYLTAEIDNIASSSITPDHLKSVHNNDEVPLQIPDQNEKNAVSESQPLVLQKYSDFTPSQGIPPAEEKSSEEDNGPIRIFVPDQYEDVNEHPTENIQVSASMNAPKNDMTIVFEHGEDESAIQQYDEIENDSSINLNKTESRSRHQEATTTSSRSKSNQDVVVMVPQNATNPTLDILTKDWKTSIIIKPKSSSKITSSPGLNEIGEFGNRIRPKE